MKKIIAGLFAVAALTFSPVAQTNENKLQRWIK